MEVDAENIVSNVVTWLQSDRPREEASPERPPERLVPPLDIERVVERVLGSLEGRLSGIFDSLQERQITQPKRPKGTMRREDVDSPFPAPRSSRLRCRRHPWA